MEKLGFVILHYCSLDDTIKCVSSIDQFMKDENYCIVIVDNASPNGTGLELQKKYKNHSYCKVILNEENVGFAKGNNTGFRYARDSFKCDYICLMNSDTYLLDDKFFTSIMNAYQKYGFYVLGPDVYTPDGVQCNPVGDHVLTYNETKQKILSLKIQILLNHVNLDAVLRKALKRNPSGNTKYKRDKYYKNVKLHGCCLVLSRKFIDEYDGLNEGTFLYLEEDLLYLMMMKDGKVTLYCPDTKIFHSEDGSTNYIKKGRKKRLFILKNHLQSMKAINRYLNETKD